MLLTKVNPMIKTILGRWVLIAIAIIAMQYLTPFMIDSYFWAIHGNVKSASLSYWNSASVSPYMLSFFIKTPNDVTRLESKVLFLPGFVLFWESIFIGYTHLSGAVTSSSNEQWFGYLDI